MSCAHEPASLEDELMVGREALWREGDLEHCRHHLAGALAQAPDDPRCLELLAQWLAAGPDIDAVLARPQRWLGDVLVEAQACMHRGDAAAALPRMLAAIAHGGDPRLLGWLQDWTRSGRIRGALDGRELASQLLAIERSAQVTEELRCGVDDWMDLIDDQVDWRDMAITVRVRFKRQLRRGEPALALARALDERAPSLGSAAALAACHRDAGDHVAALAASLLGASRDPADGFPLLDAGDTALDQLDDWEQAIAAYAEAERRGAKPEWARVSRLAAEYLREPAAATRAAFEAEADAQPDSERARQLRDRLDEWIRYIRTPREACLNLLRTVNLEQESSLHISLNAPEAASAHYLLQQACAQAGVELSVEAADASPDPRAGEPRLAAFRWQGAQVEAAQARPRRAPWGQLARLADRDFEPLAWLREVRSWSPIEAGTLVAMIPYPPAPPKPDDDPWWWRRAWTAACTFAVASREEAWADLAAIVRAPIDWPGEAALVALAAWSLEDPGRAPAWMSLLQDCRDRYPDCGDCCLRHAVDAGLRYWLEGTR